MFRKLFDRWKAPTEIEATRLGFDPVFYRQHYPDLAELSDDELLAHYCTKGWQAKRDPADSFSTRRYLEAYPDVADANINPLAHFITNGKKEGREGRPRIAMDARYDVLKGAFDPTYYRLINPYIGFLSDQRLLEHFHIYGWREGLDPNASFSVRAYLRDHSDVARADMDPFYHYLTTGKAEGRSTHAPLPRLWTHLSEEQITQLERHFDPGFYSKAIQDPAAAPRDLLAHYVESGWAEGFDPSADFSNEYYLITYGDTHGVCPLVHFVLKDHQSARRGAADQPQLLVQDPQTQTASHHMVSALKRAPAQSASPPPARIDLKDGMDLHWIIPDFPKGSGGHMTIFRIIRHLENFGHQCTIWIEQPVFHTDTADVHDDILKYFQCVQAKVRFLEDGFFETLGHAVIATSWATAYYAQSAQGFAARYYFVQDHEAEFFATGADRMLAARSYDFDLACICAGPWLAEMMQTRYGRWSRGFDLAYDRRVYDRQQGTPDVAMALTKPGKRLKIAMYARQHTARRCVDLALMGLELLSLKRDDFEVHFFGQDDMPFSAAPFRAFNHGVLSDVKLAQLYNECDLGLCFSATNYSLVPQEMMACGLPVVELDTDSTRAVFPQGVVTLVGPEPADIAQGLGALMDASALRAAQQKAATGWVSTFSWERSARTVEDALLAYLNETTEVLSTPAIAQDHHRALEVFIPTFNGIGEIERTIAALRCQRIHDQFQIHCIDSSSTDGTTEWLRAQPDVALSVIAQEQFQHGATRNQAAATGKAPVFAFLTQDATPLGSDWASDILKMMRHYPQAAGLFGRHKPYPQHSLRVRQEIDRHFENMLKHPLALSRDTDRVLWQSGDTMWRQFLHYFSDNNAALRRHIWEDIPYPEVDYGEDQLWARTIIEAGHTKLYAPTAMVMHSHDFSPAEAYARAKTEAAFFYTHFGYEMGEGTDEAVEARLRDAQQALVGWARRHHVSREDLAREQDITAHRYRGWRDGRKAAQQAG